MKPRKSNCDAFFEIGHFLRSSFSAFVSPIANKRPLSEAIISSLARHRLCLEQWNRETVEQFSSVRGFEGALVVRVGLTWLDCWRERKYIM